MIALSPSQQSVAGAVESHAATLSGFAGHVTAPPSRLYLFTPALDLLVIGGGLSLLVLPFAFLVAPATGAVVFMLLQLVCNYPHYMATNYRVYGSRAQLRRYRFFAIYVTAAILLIAVASHALVGAWVNLLVIAYLFLGPYHYTGQNYGIALMYARRGGIDVTRGEKRLLYASGVAFMLTYLLLITIRPVEITLPALSRLALPADAARLVYGALVVAGVACASAVFGRLARRAPLRVLVPVIFLTAAQLAWFVLPGAIVLFGRHLSLTGLQLALFVPAINFLHCAQYLGVTAYYTKRERAAAAQPFHIGRYLLVLVVGGALLWPVAMRLFSEAFVVDYALSVLAFNALINIHHYVLDGAIWKLRDGRIARLLVATEAPAAVAAPAPTPQAVGWSGIRHGVAWAAVACLALTVFAADSLRGYMLVQAAELRNGQKWSDAKEFYRSALRFNGRTTDAIEGLAVAEMQAGKLTQAAEHWEESVRLNPISAHLRAGLGETYLKLGRIDEGLEQLEQAVLLAPRDEISLRLLAQGHWAKGDHAQARVLIERAETVAAEASRKRLAL